MKKKMKTLTNLESGNRNTQNIVFVVLVALGVIAIVVAHVFFHVNIESR